MLTCRGQPAAVSYPALVASAGTGPVGLVQKMHSGPWSSVTAMLVVAAAMHSWDQMKPRIGGAGFHRNRPAAGKAKPTLSAGIVRRVRNADGIR